MNLLCFIDVLNVIEILEDMIKKYNNFNTFEPKSDHKRDIFRYQHHFKKQGNKKKEKYEQENMALQLPTCTS